MKKIMLTALLLLALLMLTACRTRTTAAQSGTQGQTVENLPSAQTDAVANGDVRSGGSSALSGEADDEPSAATTRTPDAEHRAYDENASAEVVPGTSRLIGNEA